MTRTRSSTAPPPGAPEFDLLGAQPSRPPLPPGPFLVVGLGRSGIFAARVLAAEFGAASVRAWDASADASQQAYAAELRALGSEVRLGGDGLDLLDGVATVVKSPGVPPEVPPVAAALARGIDVYGEFEIGWRMIPAPTVAVTGTKGKSTVAAVCTAILAAHDLEPELCGNTSFGAAITELVEAPPGSLVAEVSSYQLEFTNALLADAAIFTNLGRDHLQRHGTVAAYGAAKRNLFVRGDAAVPLAVLNVDDPFGACLAEEVEERGGRALRYGRGEAADYRVAACHWDLRGAEVEVETPTGPVEFATRLPGLHNAANATAVLALADGLGLPREPTLAALATAAPVPGRFETVELGTPFDVVVDLGSNPVGIAAALESVRPIATARGGRLLTVLSGIGYSAVEHGPTSGALAREFSDHLILAGSSYRGEPRLPIVAALAGGARAVDGGGLEIVIDRREAIGRAIEMARPGDIVLVLGRGQVFREATDGRGSFVHLHDATAAREFVETLA